MWSNRKWQRRFLAAVIIVAVLFFFRNSFSKGMEVKGYEVGGKELLISVSSTSTGTIKADKEVKLTSQRMGRIAGLHVEEGTIVKKDGLAADLDYEEQQQRLQIAAAALQRAEAGLGGLKAALASFRTEVESGITRASSVLAEAAARLKRFSELREGGYLSQMEFDSVKRDFDIAKANFDSALAAREQIRSKEDEIRGQEAAIRQARSEYALAKINLDYSFIRTPMDGIVTARPVKLGETVPIGALIATVVSKDSLYIEAFIDEADADKVSPGQTANISMDAYQGKVFSGRVYMISPVVLGGKQEARTFEIRVRLEDKAIVVKPGMSADVEVIIDTLKNIVVVPSQAIMEKNDEKFVYIVKKGKAVRTAVATGRFNWNYTEITQGVNKGDIVITNPDAPGLSNGAGVRVAKIEK